MQDTTEQELEAALHIQDGEHSAIVDGCKGYNMKKPLNIGNSIHSEFYLIGSKYLLKMFCVISLCICIIISIFWSETILFVWFSFYTCIIHPQIAFN